MKLANCLVSLITLSIYTSAIGAVIDLPNIILIVTDDQGYNDVGFNGGTEIPTPNLDRIAQEGIVFRQGYVSYPVCGPSRAGLLTGRYQGRFGFTRNPTMDPASRVAGMPVEEDMISEILKKVGYTNMVVGKWHMGVANRFHPLQQGYDEFFGFLSGGHRYFPEELVFDSIEEASTNGGRWYFTRLLHDYNRIDIDQYLTDELSDQAVKFVEREKDGPFFLYLAYNAPHSPLQATDKYLNRFSHVADPKRRTYAAMVSAVDDGVGRLFDSLDRNGIAENTLIFFLSDNGGPEKNNSSDNGVLRAGKGSLFEGGIRVPFAMRWPSRLDGGMIFEHPVSSLDILATVIAEVKAPIASERPLDGIDLMPYLLGVEQGRPHDALFWRNYDKGQYAVRVGDLKIVAGETRGGAVLFNVKEDVSEMDDIWSGNRRVVDDLNAMHSDWERQLIGPVFPELGSWKRFSNQSSSSTSKP